MANFSNYDFNTILNNILTDYSNLDSSPDVSVGGQPWINANVLASAVWGLYYFQDQYVKKQLFVDEADTEYLNHWGSIFNVVRVSSDTNSTYLNKVLSRLRQAPAGGNSLDFENWALDRDNCYITYGGTTYYNAIASIVSNPGNVLGMVGIYTIPTDETIIDIVKSSGANTSVTPNKLIDSGADFTGDSVAIGDPVSNTTNNTIGVVSNVDSGTILSINQDIFTTTPLNYTIKAAEELLRRVTETYIESVRPLGMKGISVESSKPLTQAVSMDVTAPSGGNVDTNQIKTAVENYLDGHKPGESLFASRLEYIAMANGAYTAVTTTPAIEETTVNNNQHIRKGTVVITEV